MPKLTTRSLLAPGGVVSGLSQAINRLGTLGIQKEQLAQQGEEAAFQRGRQLRADAAAASKAEFDKNRSALTDFVEISKMFGAEGGMSPLGRAVGASSGTGGRTAKSGEPVGLDDVFDATVREVANALSDKPDIKAMSPEERDVFMRAVGENANKMFGEMRNSLNLQSLAEQTGIDAATPEGKQQLQMLMNQRRASMASGLQQAQMDPRVRDALLGLFDKAHGTEMAKLFDPDYKVEKTPTKATTAAGREIQVSPDASKEEIAAAARATDAAAEAEKMLSALAPFGTMAKTLASGVGQALGLGGQAQAQGEQYGPPVLPQSQSQSVIVPPQPTNIPLSAIELVGANGQRMNPAQMLQRAQTDPEFARQLSIEEVPGKGVTYAEALAVAVENAAQEYQQIQGQPLANLVPQDSMEPVKDLQKVQRVTAVLDHLVNEMGVDPSVAGQIQRNVFRPENDIITYAAVSLASETAPENRQAAGQAFNTIVAMAPKKFEGMSQKEVSQTLETLLRTSPTAGKLVIQALNE